MTSAWSGFSPKEAVFDEEVADFVHPVGGVDHATPFDVQ